MPQASDAQRRRWGGRHGVGEDKAEGFLKSRGYVLTRQWYWTLPKPDHYVTAEEADAMQFLMDEWDYGGIKA